VYRVSQFFRALVAWVPKRELGLLSEYLTPPQAELFQRMPRSDQRHGLDVFHALRRKRQHAHDLLVAALLHDVGKSGGGLRLWHRVLIVLIKALWPQLLDRLSRSKIASRGGSHACPERRSAYGRRAADPRAWEPALLRPEHFVPGTQYQGPVEGLQNLDPLRLASDEPRNWRYPFFVHQHHPELGAELAQAAGCSPTTAELIRRHQQPPVNNPLRTHRDKLLAALQEADGVN